MDPARESFYPTLPFRVLPEVMVWQEQFRPEKLALRYTTLALIGHSRAGKTNFAQSLFGRRNTLTVSCQCLGGNLPDIRPLDVSCHAAIVWDECDARQILNNKVVFQSGPIAVTLAQSACNAHAYVKYLHRVAHIVCAIFFARKVGDVCADGSCVSEADADWLEANVVFVDLAPQQSLYEKPDSLETSREEITGSNGDVLGAASASRQ